MAMSHHGNSKYQADITWQHSGLYTVNLLISDIQRIMFGGTKPPISGQRRRGGVGSLQRGSQPPPHQVEGWKML